MPTKQKPKQFVFKMNNGARFIGTGKTEEEVLLKHIILKTKEVGHQISFNEANDPDFIVMVKPSEFVFPFSSFDRAAEIAWRRTRPSNGTGLTKEGKKLKKALHYQRV